MLLSIIQAIILSQSQKDMLKHLQKTFNKCSFAIEKKLFVYDPPFKNPANDSGIKATIFGPSGLMGRPIGALLGQIGSRLVMPVSLEHHYPHSEQLKQLKVFAPVNKSWIHWGMNLRNDQQIQQMVTNSNVVINCLGPRHKIKNKQDFEWINIQVPRKIAKACSKYGVHRLIHFSAAGAQQNSTSLDFQTKWHGQRAVLEAFPNATIFRPCPIVGTNDYFASIIQRQSSFFFNKFVFVYDDCKTLKQPIRENDVAQCVLNALKLQQTKGKTYQLGGPHALSMLQIHEIMFNIKKMKSIRLAYINPEWAMNVAKYVYNWQFFSQQMIRKRTIEQIVKPNKYRTIQDLKIQPVSFKSAVFQILRQYIPNFYQRDEDTEN